MAEQLIPENRLEHWLDEILNAAKGTKTYTVSGTGTTPVALPEGLTIPTEMTEGFTASLDIAGTTTNNEQFDLTELPLLFILNGSLNFNDIYFAVDNDTCAFSCGYIDDGSLTIDSTKPLTWSITFTDSRGGGGEAKPTQYTVGENAANWMATAFDTFIGKAVNEMQQGQTNKWSGYNTEHIESTDDPDAVDEAIDFVNAVNDTDGFIVVTIDPNMFPKLVPTLFSGYDYGYGTVGFNTAGSAGIGGGITIAFSAMARLATDTAGEVTVADILIVGDVHIM